MTDIVLQNAFGMNVVELNPGGYTSLARFFEATLPLTFFTIWIIVAFQSRFILRDNSGGVWKKLLWPVMLFNAIIPWSTTKKDDLDDLRLEPMSANSVI
jgi:hypothetical protein